MLLAKIEQIDEDFLRTLCDDHCPESDSLDFKRELPSGSKQDKDKQDKDKQELLKDVCAFANADGGDLVYGIEEKNGGAAALFPITSENFDAAKRRISQVLDAGLEPRVQGIRIRHVEVNNGYVLVIRVPSSFDGPHCVRVQNNQRRFVMRNGTSTTDLNYDQIRAAFDRTATFAERARRFIDQRLQLLIDRKTPMVIVPGPICVVHAIPIAGLAGRHTVDLRPLHANGFISFLGNDWGGGSRTYNLDGLVIHPSGSPMEENIGYAQIFRTGSVEFSCLGGGTYQRNPNESEKNVIWSARIHKVSATPIPEVGELL